MSPWNQRIRRIVAPHGPIRAQGGLCATLCYMEDRQVGVRELRQNLSRYLRRVQRGERLEVTDHGVPVAVLAPLGQPTTTMERLIAAGRVTAPRADLLGQLPPRGRVSTAASEALGDERADRL